MFDLRQAVVLAGGLGERLRPLTNEIPKPLIPIQGKPILEHVLDILQRSNIEEVYLSIGYLANKIQDHFEDGSKFGVTIHYIVEKKRAGTGGWMFLIDSSNFDDHFVVLNGDNLMNIDFQRVLPSHLSSNAAATIIARPIPANLFGAAELLNVENDRRFSKYIDRDMASSFLEGKDEVFVSSGYYIFRKSIFSLCPKMMPMSNEKDLFPLLANNGKLNVYTSRDSWFDTGTFERLEDVEANWSFKL